MSSAADLWRQFKEFVATWRASFGTHWVQPENRVTRAIDRWAAAQLAQATMAPAEESAPAEQAPNSRPGQAA